MSQRKPCNFFRSSRGCRDGDACRFAHGPTSPTPSSSGRGLPHNRSPSDKLKICRGAPHGVCNDFWSSGKCRHAFGCRYKHVRPNQTSSPATREAVQDGPMPILQEGGYAKLGSGGSDAFHPVSSRNMDPNEAHNALKQFLHENYRFRNVFGVYAFLVPVSSANSTSTLWSGEEGQLFLKALSAGNGLLRMNDIITWSDVAPDAGSKSTVLSFQRGYVPILSFLSSDFVVKSTLSSLVNALYLCLLQNFGHFSRHLTACMDALIASGSFRDSNFVQNQNFSGSTIFLSLSIILFECLSRFKNAIATYPQLVDVIRCLDTWYGAWANGISKVPPTFEDVLAAADKQNARSALLPFLLQKIQRVVTIVDREQAKLDRANKRIAERAAGLGAANRGSNEGIISALHTLFDGPGELRKGGPRHDNDFAEIDQVRIAPTNDELICQVPPYLPANLHAAPHHLPQESMERLLDIQFRLLREELTAPLRTSLQYVKHDLVHPKANTQLKTIIAKQGGKYKGSAAMGQDSVLFNIYTNVDFLSIAPDWRGLSVMLSFDTPPGRGRTSQAHAREAFWAGQSGKRLMQGGLVGLVWSEGDEVAIHLGIVASSSKEAGESAKASEDRVSIRVVFFDTSVELRILSVLKHATHGVGQRMLVESPVMYEAVRPFLEALRVEPESIPFKDYLVHRPSSFLATCTVSPPRYARMHGFCYQLAPLFPQSAGVTDLKLDATSPHSIEQARLALKDSRLDPSQAAAVVDALTREISLIQGPPGTGKSYVGIELLRVLIKSAKPILMIAFTNHALDHLLRGVLDAGITDKVVRLGSRSADERVAEFSMDNLELVAGRNSRLGPMSRTNYYNLKEIRREIEGFMEDVVRGTITSQAVMDFIEVQYPDLFFGSMLDPPVWVDRLHRQNIEWANEGWSRAHGKGKGKGRHEDEDLTLYRFWCRGEDIQFLSNPILPPPILETPVVETVSAPNKNRYEILLDYGEDDDYDLEDWQKFAPEDERTVPRAVETLPNSPADVMDGNTSLPQQHLSNVEAFFLAHGIDDCPPAPPPDRIRTIEELLVSGDMWSMSSREREALDNYWKSQVRIREAQKQEDKFILLRRKHTELLQTYNEGQEEIRRHLLEQVDIVGCTTTGAAKLTSLLKGLAPRVMLVEEAGQVLEAHILGSLVPSVEHMILIGDPLQLRPTLNNYSLSMDSKQGEKLYRFDMSLMERLSSSGFPMSQIDVQRRMRPAISKLIRHTLYPNLVDNDLVKNYPDVRGLSKNVFFLDHQHGESGGGEDSGSRHNVYEVNMIRDLVLYLLRQGCYSQDGDIVVLCAYLGQLAKVRDALQDMVAVVIDERDQADLEAKEDEDSEESGLVPQIDRVKVSQRVRLRTVDNYQGEEAKIVILSLVRNPGSSEAPQTADRQHRSTIGFLKSENRTNVALSRAKEGLYILGNRPLLAAKSRMWQKILQELEDDDCIGPGFPVACFRHPQTQQFVSVPGRLPSIAPDGGCLEPCDARLECGHVCPYKCHPDDPNHVAVECMQPCTKLCIRGHPCRKPCFVSCGFCIFQICDVELPCGHTAPSVYCFQMDDLTQVKCKVQVSKALPTCEHTAFIECSQEPDAVRCTEQCKGILACCGRTCNRNCVDCQSLNAETGPGIRRERAIHQDHPCEKLLYCAHRCGLPCSSGHECNMACRQECRQRCSHSKCKKACAALCSPCQRPCQWTCPHFSCPVPCGSVCVRLPCDQRCTSILQCGHRCPSVCGEPCALQVCPHCATEDNRDVVVDLVLQQTLAEFAVEPTAVEELLITLPECRHVFTVETLDGICELKDWYEYDDALGKWRGLRAPASSNTKKPPLCPTCRAAITSPRYGRVFKSADLEILEKNVISGMTSGLNMAQKAHQKLTLESIERSLEQGVGGITVLKVNIDDWRKLGIYKQELQKPLRTAHQQRKPLPPKALDPAAGESPFNPSTELVRIWRSQTQPVFRILTELGRVAEIRSAHIHAWQAAFSYLYEQELQAYAIDPSRAPRRPEEHAMRMARMKLGQPQPRSDKRFLVEAIWLSITLRFDLASLVVKFINYVDSEIKAGIITKAESQAWATYGSFILDTCKQDATLAATIAEDCQAHRLITRSKLFIARSNLHRFLFTFDMTKRFGKLSASRDKLLAAVAEQKTLLEGVTAETLHRHLSVLPHDLEWVDTNFSSVAASINAEWDAIETSIRQDTFYQPVSRDEKLAIVQAFGREFSHAGHWYNCPNGHTYVIGECGGAMVTARCPDCGETIGGANHREAARNTQAAEFVALAMGQGAAGDIWHR